MNIDENWGLTDERYPLFIIKKVVSLQIVLNKLICPNNKT